MCGVTPLEVYYASSEDEPWRLQASFFEARRQYPSQEFAEPSRYAGRHSSLSCFGPLTAYYGKTVNPVTGRRPMVFDVRRSFDGLRIPVPCGQCIGCRLERSRLWAIRCMHEKRLHHESAFITLTYDNDHVPAGGSLRKRDLQLFFKRLRKVRPSGLRMFSCGEYGESTRRPHYHCLLFNTRFADQRHYKRSPAGFELYRSVELESLWPFGSNTIGDVSFDSAAYVARYCLKKVTGKASEVHYSGREPEFVVMSRRPGIGRGWFEKFHAEAYKADSAIMDHREVGLPRYYDNLFSVVDGDRLDELKAIRKDKAHLHFEDQTPSRLRVRERFEELKFRRFAREPCD
ncbi:replication initiator protein [Blackfly microvirus SF02]|uniref:Replication initiator protein n=1 Tax=Blackfly microvirus SF02 TaxID=2576452 RepID=A0A4P8PK93_9VIRU|nr:replication initiator protein [Blackfly microvirus SF02]